MAHWRDAVQPHAEGIRLLVEVAAGAKAERFPDGFNAWRDGRLGVRVRAPAEGGRANADVLRVVARMLGVPAARVRIEAGALDARKALVVTGVTPEAVCVLLEPLLEERSA